MTRLLTTILLLLTILSAKALTWYDGTSPVSCTLPATHDKVLDVAIQMFSDDILSVTGQRPVVAKRYATITVVQADRVGKGERRRLAALGIPMDSLATAIDAFAIKIADGRIYAVGSNGRGAAYALLELSRLVGVSPWVWWGDDAPDHRTTLTIADDYFTFQKAAVERRGIFLNDEDWSLLPWSHKTHDPADSKIRCAAGRDCQRIGVNTYREIFKLLLRLRANMIWPAMHEQTVPFYQVEGAKEAADSFAIIVGTSHCEPLMRNNTTEWSLSERGAFNYLTNSEQVKDYWISRLKETASSPNVYTIGMRGIHDGSMEGPKTLEEKTYWLQRVIDDQREMLATYVNKDVASIPQAFVPYKEVLEIYENGLRVPDDVTLIWCDDNYGYLTRLPDAQQQKRSGGHGLYYHLSYWGRPHSYLWHTTTQPGLIYNELREAYSHNVRRQWIFNVHDVKCAARQLEVCLDMAWQGPSTSLYDQRLTAVDSVEWEYSRLAAIRRPEFMGWNQVELDKKKYPSGKSPIADTEFSFEGDYSEADRYLHDYQLIAAKCDSIEQSLPSSRRDNFFAAHAYRIKTSALFAQRLLEGQRARILATASDSSSVVDRNISIAKVIDSEARIHALTQRYNSLAGGKWAGLMDDKPQNYPVYGAVPLPYTLSQDSVAIYLAIDKERHSATPSSESFVHGYTLCTSHTKLRGSSFHLSPVPQLGHSMAALPIPKGEWIEYEVEGDCVVALIPTQPSDRGDLRFSVSVDGGEAQVFSLKEPYRSEQWKLNVLRQQARRHVSIPSDGQRHLVRITALDDHVVLDQVGR